jgi:CHRD domain/PEP-CTERM motif
VSVDPGLSEAPPDASPGTGYAVVTLDTAAHTLGVPANFSGLLGTTTAAHIHCSTLVPGVDTVQAATDPPSFVGIPLGVTSGTIDSTFDTTLARTFHAQFIAPGWATTALAEERLAAGRASDNIHSSFAPGGEIRGFLQPIPEPATYALVGVALLAVAVGRRK